MCGTLGTLLKVRAKSHPGTPEHKARKSNGSNEVNALEEKGREEKKDEIEMSKSSENSEGVENLEDGIKPTSISHKKIDFNQKIGSHIDKLDSLINKAEHAQYSMQHQTKQIKQFLK